MSDYTNDVRTRIADREHKVLTAESQSTGRDIADIVRGLIVEHVESRIQLATSITAVLRDDKGSTGTRGGADT